MQFLGSLGIDIKLLIAQMVNFGLLLWLLTKFLYKPIIKRIEKDEAEFERIKIKSAELEQQKKDFEDKSRTGVAETKKRMQQMIKEAETIAQKIKTDTSATTSKESEMLIEQSKNQIKSLRPKIEKELLERVRGGISESFNTSFVSALPLSSQKEFQDVFWINLIEQVKTVSVPKPKESDFIETFKKSYTKTKEKSANKNVLENKLEEIFSKNIGPLVLEYVYAPTKEQEDNLEKIILEKVGLKLTLTKKQNKDLISGFRFEFAGMIIESNLFNIIRDALRSKK